MSDLNTTSAPRHNFRHALHGLRTALLLLIAVLGAGRCTLADEPKNHDYEIVVTTDPTTQD